MNMRRYRKRAYELGLLLALLAATLVVTWRSLPSGATPGLPLKGHEGLDLAGHAGSIRSVRQAGGVSMSFPELLVEAMPMGVREPAINSATRGFETPFSGTTPPLELEASLDTDVTRLRAALMGALATGSPDEMLLLLNSGAPEMRMEAIRQLLQIDSPEAVAAALMSILTLSTADADYDGYIAAFAECHDAVVVEWLCRFLGETQSREGRERALAILGALRGPEVIASLAAQIQAPADSLHAEDCADLLAGARNPAQIGALKGLIDADPSPDTQELAAFGLASVGNAEACSVLIEKGSSDGATASACRDALATVDSGYGQETLIQVALNPDAPSVVRIAAVQALANQQGQRVYTVLANVGQKSMDPGLQAAIEQALEMTEPDSTPVQPGGMAADRGADGEKAF